MPNDFQRLLALSGPETLSLNAQAALGAAKVPRRSQFSLLVRHFLERFFNHETASADGDAKARMVLIAVATGLPGFVVGLYLWPLYHPFMATHRGDPLGPPPYWIQVNHHFFFVVYSFVAMGIATVFEWDLFFPDLLDVFILTTLPIPSRTLFRARIAAIAVFALGFLVDANMLAPLILPASLDPPNLPRFMAAHLAAVLLSGLFSAVFILALQSALLSILGEALFRRISLLLQGLAISVLLMLLLLFPVVSGAVPVLLQSQSAFVLYCPPFWFLGIYQRLLEGPSALPIYTHLAQIGCTGLSLSLALAIVAYPVAYLRKTRQLVVGLGTHDTRSLVASPLSKVLHVTLLRSPSRRAVFHFISQSLFRVQRYRIYLVLYGGVGLAIVAASLLRITVQQGRLAIALSPIGLRATIGILAFWIIAGLRMAFVSPGNRQGSWVFHILHGRPPRIDVALEQLKAAKIWALLWAVVITSTACLASHFVHEPEMRRWSTTAGLLFIAGSLSLLLSDVLFLNVKIVAFSGQPPREQPNLAFALMKTFTFFPFVVTLPIAAEPWIQVSVLHFLVAATVVAVAHFVLELRHRRVIEEHCNMPGLEEGEEDFPMKLGLRY